MTPGIASLNPGLMSVQPFRAAGLHAGGVVMTPGIASLNPGLMSEQPYRAAGLHAGGVKKLAR